MWELCPLLSYISRSNLRQFCSFPCLYIIQTQKASSQCFTPKAVSKKDDDKVLSSQGLSAQDISTEQSQ